MLYFLRSPHSINSPCLPKWTSLPIRGDWWKDHSKEVITPYVWMTAQWWLYLFTTSPPLLGKVCYKLQKKKYWEELGSLKGALLVLEGTFYHFLVLFTFSVVKDHQNPLYVSLKSDKYDEWISSLTQCLALFISMFICWKITTTCGSAE